MSRFIFAPTSLARWCVVCVFTHKMLTHTHTHTCLKRILTPLHPHAHTHKLYTHTHTRTHALTITHTLSCIHTRMHTHTRAHSHSRSHTHALTLTHIPLAYIHTCTRTHGTFANISPCGGHLRAWPCCFLSCPILSSCTHLSSLVLHSGIPPPLCSLLSR